MAPIQYANIKNLTPMRLSVVFSLIFIAFTFSVASANAETVTDFEKASTLACEKMKSCAMAEMGDQEGMTPQMRQMIEGMVSGICDNIMDVEQMPQSDELYSAATACMNSMAGLSCSQLDDDIQTVECDKLESLASKYQ